MFDSQKLSVNSFINGYKHGIYVFIDDACSICQDYKQSIEYINNAYLYFVEVSVESQREQIRKILDRSIFPMTACFRDNKLKYVRPGQLFDLQLEEIFKDLKTFGDKPLPPEEIERRLEAERTKCLLSYYVFMPSISDSDKEAVMKEAIKYNELPIDIDTFLPYLSDEKRLHILEGEIDHAKLVIIKDNITNIASPFCQKLTISYAAINNNDMKFEVRQLSDILSGSVNAGNNTGK